MKAKTNAMFFLLIACICGWFVMELEILGVRMLAPYFGSAVYVVTGSVIGVFLLSLAIGYIIGGWLSKLERRQSFLGGNICAAGILVAALPYMDEAICDSIFRIGLDEKWGSLLASLILFGIPTMLLGTVSPILIRLVDSIRSNSGLSAGLVLAFSTIASFAGCVITAFYLVLISLKLTLVFSSVVLMLLGILILLGSFRPRQVVTELPAHTGMAEIA